MTPMTELMPFSTPGMYSFGTAPPTTFDSNAVALAGLVRLEDDLDASKLARAAGLLLVRVILLECDLVSFSRYATCGAPMLASTL